MVKSVDRTVQRILAESKAAGARVERAHPAAEGLRVRANAATDAVSFVWYAPRSADGKRPVHVIGAWPAMSPKDAAERLEALRVDVKRAASGLPGPGREARTAMTLRELLALFWWKDLRARRLRWPPVLVLRNHVLDILGWNTEVRTIRPHDVERVIEKLTNAGKSVQAVKVLALVKQMFLVAVRAHVIERSPAADITRRYFKIRTPHRVRRWTADELGAVWRVLHEEPTPSKVNNSAERREVARLGLIVLLATGRRTGELVQGRKEHFDLDAAVWTVPPEVRKFTRDQEAEAEPDRVHLSPQVVRALRRLFALAPSSPWALGTPLDSSSGHVDDSTLGRAFREMQRGGPLKLTKPATVHDFRKAIRSTVVQQRWCSHAAAEVILGHEIGGVMGTYDLASYDEERAAALDRWTAYLDALAGFGEAKVANLDARRA